MKRGRKLHTQHDDDLLRAFAAGATVREAAGFAGIPAWKVRHVAKRLGVVPTKLRPGPPPSDKVDPRAHLMAALYQDGRTLAQIGQQYSITGERVRQILRKHTAVTAETGGKRLVARLKREARATAKDIECMQQCGCTFEQYKQLRQIGRDMVAAGIGVYRTPLRAFATQRRNAADRRIGWELNVWQWWSIWQASGKWDQRGRRAGDYVMCRKGDVGPYALGNVFIAPSQKNVSDANNRSGLPIGVAKCKSGRFSASRQIQGKQVYLGVFPTAEIAHAAYLASLSSSSAEAA